MARYTGSVCRLCRREGTKLFLKGERCYSAKCAITKRPTPPGQHGQARARKMSEYGMQLREKQKIRRTYGMLETQFRRTFEKANRQKGVTGDNMLALLERRLDNVVYRLGLASSRAQARQFVRHGHISVDGKKVNIPSYTVDVGQTIAVRGAFQGPARGQHPCASQVAVLRRGEPDRQRAGATAARGRGDDLRRASGRRVLLQVRGTPLMMYASFFAFGTY